MKKKWLIPCRLLLVLIATLLVITIPVMAEEYTTYRLKEITRTGTVEPFPPSPYVRIDDVHYDTQGGYVKFTELSENPSPTCTGQTQRFTLEWTFDRDVNVLSGKSGDKLFSILGKVTGDPGNDCLNVNPGMALLSGYGMSSDTSHLPQPWNNDVIVYQYEQPYNKAEWIFNPVGYFYDNKNPGAISYFLNLNQYRGGGFTIYSQIPRVSLSGGYVLAIHYLYEGVPGEEVSPQLPVNTCNIVGTWDWLSSLYTVYVHPDGNIEAWQAGQKSVDGTWTKSGNTYVWTWSHGYIDTVTISPDCKSLTGYNNYGRTDLTGTLISSSDTTPSPPPQPQTPQSPVPSYISSPTCVWNIYGMSVQLGASFAHANKDDAYNLKRALSYAIDNCKGCCCRPEVLQDLLNRLNAGESTQSLFQNGLAPLLDNREKLGLQDCSCSLGTSGASSDEIWYIYGMGVQLGAAHAWAYHDDRAALQGALRYSLQNCKASKCCKPEPIQDLINRLAAGESTQSIFYNGIIPLIDNSERLGLQDCTCGKPQGGSSSSSQTGSFTSNPDWGCTKTPIVINAVDNDPANQLGWASSRVPFGNENCDAGRLFTFRYQVPAGGVKDAILTMPIKTMCDADTDNIVAAIGQPLKECGGEVQGKMAGCAVLHGGLAGYKDHVDMDLLNTACVPAMKVSADARSALASQLQTGVLHVQLQDDTAVYGAQLVLNCAPSCPGAGTGQTGTGTGQTGTGTAQPTSLNPPGQGCKEGVTSVYADYRAMNPGQDVVIPIIMCNARDVANMDLTVTYDSSVLRFMSATKGSLNANTLFDSNNVGNTVKIAFAGKTGFSGTGSIAVLTFTVIGKTGSSSPITIKVNEASTSTGTPVDVSVQNGQVQVGNTNPNNPGGNPTGKPTSLDALKALQMSVGKLAEDLNYDLTKDGKVTSGDARSILLLAEMR